MVQIFTIGFTKTSAEHFFGRLKDSQSRKLVDVRLNNVSQLAGFAKRDDLRFFTKSLCNMEYSHVPKLAPTKSMLDAYKSKKVDWATYERQFLDLMISRQIEKIKPAELDGCCLLCSEDTPHFCHRRVVAEYLNREWGNVEIIHL
ncbi:DUF488 domain-containing protein [Salipiger sp. 1_MG-2023]|uniref:DUF488 domain-containing protein n=1 Tax=Salipiger sp. 1_MG-2023 TaxID=3062665 RepID=UPI0026E139D0|nr:DUF488 domain-containing protein [Salipiger sp. 1_MG-2023]MDO6588556.1 DUF488 domain-containing protein [Salipiger sp. 1_MG-2023]